MKTEPSQTLWERRDRLHIMKEIMETSKGGQLKTRIMYIVNLSYTQVNEYLSYLTERGFLNVQVKNGKTFYKTTAKGNIYIENYRELSNLLNNQDPVVESSILEQ